MKVLLTGGSGYIGTEFREHCHGYDIFNFDISKHQNYDVSDYYPLLAYIRDHDGIDIIIHMAAISGIKKCEEDPIKARNTNIEGTINVAMASSRLNIPLIFLSTQAVKNPVNLYGETKKEAEYNVRLFSNRYCIMRLTNVYGGKTYFEKKNTVIKQFLTSDNIVVHGDGTQQRNFVHVNDVCRAIQLAIKKFICFNEFDNKYRFGFTFDVHGPTGDTMSVLELANVIQRYSGKEIVYDKNTVGGENAVALNYGDNPINYFPIANIRPHIRNFMKGVTNHV